MIIKKIIKKYSFLVGVFVFIWIVKDLDFRQIKENASLINWLYYVVAASLYIPMTLLKSYRWKSIMDVQKIHYSFKNALLMFGSSSLLGLVTPGRIGDFSKVAYLKKDNYSTGRAILGNLMDKFFDFLFIVIFIIIIRFLLPFTPDLSLNYVLLVKWTAFVLLLVLSFLFLFYLRNKDNFRKFILEVRTDIKQFKVTRIIFIFFITAVAWMFFFLIAYLIATSIGISQTIGLLYLSFTVAISSLIGLLPISVLGIGTREAVFVFFLTPLGISKEIVILFSLLVLLNYLSLFFIYFLCWLKKPVI